VVYLGLLYPTPKKSVVRDAKFFGYLRGGFVWSGADPRRTASALNSAVNSARGVAPGTFGTPFFDCHIRNSGVSADRGQAHIWL
jgi:hypothetical protein